jgi:glyoxylase-like metal-dependent hydrolase (beta-lactamase superfamily II)
LNAHLVDEGIHMTRVLIVPILAVALWSPGPSRDVVAAQSQPPQSALMLEVYTSNDYGYATTSTIVYGASEAILLDPQFLASDARNVATMIKLTGRKLTTVYTSHAHPDHFFGIAAIKQAFPGARYVALPEVVKRIATAWPGRREFWLPTYGDELPSAEPIMPEPLPSPRLTLEGHVLEITGEVIGDGPGNSFVWIPSLRAVVAGDVVFHERHLGVPADPAPWLATLDRIDALKPAVLVPGHKRSDVPNDPRATRWMREYIADFNAFRAQSKSAAELKARVLAKYPKAALPARLDQAAEAAFPAVPTR